MRNLLLVLLLSLPCVAAVAAAQPLAERAPHAPNGQEARVQLPATEQAPVSLKVSPVWPLEPALPGSTDEPDADTDQDSSWGSDHEAPGAIPAFEAPRLAVPAQHKLPRDPADGSSAPTRPQSPAVRPPRG